MANDTYASAREGFLLGEINWSTGVFKAYIVDLATYAPDLGVDKWVDDIPDAARVAVSPALTGKTATGGVADADDTTVASVPAGPAVEALVVAQTSAVGGGADVADTAQRLVAYVDTATGLPVVPNGGPMNITWDNGANKIFRL